MKKKILYNRPEHPLKNSSSTDNEFFTEALPTTYSEHGKQKLYCMCQQNINQSSVVAKTTRGKHLVKGTI